jgi:signal peptide peptidase SppA
MNTELWAGTERGFSDYQAILKKIEDASEELQQRASNWEASNEGNHWMLDVKGDVATVRIDGGMVKGSAGFFGQMFGYTGYDDIKDAVLEGLDKGATKFLFDMDTPGGMVSGIEDISGFIKELSTKYETTAFTSELVASAGLWLATAANEFYATKMSSVGSIGVIAVHTEVTKMMEDQGVSKTVFRSAPMKALGGPFEKLTDEARAMINKDIQQSHDFFVSAISENTGLSIDYVAKELATGELWQASEALDKGLLTGISTFDEVFIALSSENVENTTDYRNSPSEVNMRTKRISAKSAAAIASGVPLDVALEDEPIEPVEIESETEEVVTDPVEEETPAAEETPVAAESPTLLKEMTNQLVDSKVALASAQTQISSMQASHDSMKRIVVNAIQRIYVGMGSPAPDTDGLLAMDASLLVQQHAQVDAQLSKRFGIGAQISVTTNDDDEENAAIRGQEDYERSRRLELARIKKTG